MSPRTWGWTSYVNVYGEEGYDVPTHVGVDHGHDGSFIRSRRMSPRTWGWTSGAAGVSTTRP